jgi:hypothetical protein
LILIKLIFQALVKLFFILFHQCFEWIFSHHVLVWGILIYFTFYFLLLFFTFYFFLLISNNFCFSSGNFSFSLSYQLNFLIIFII